MNVAISKYLFSVIIECGYCINLWCYEKLWQECDVFRHVWYKMFGIFFQFGATVTEHKIFSALTQHWEEEFHKDMEALNVRQTLHAKSSNEIMICRCYVFMSCI